MQRTSEVDAVEATELVGGTPLVSLTAFAPELYGQFEAANPFSVKDHIARERTPRP